MPKGYPDRTYVLSLYQRTKPGGTTGELVSRWEIRVPGLAHAMQIAESEHLANVDLKSKFAVIEGDSGFIHCRFENIEHA